MKIAAVQLLVRDGDEPSDRREAVAAAVAQQAAAGADLVVLPEMWLPGYFAFDSYAEVGEDLSGGLVTGQMAELAREHSVYLCAGSLVERHEGQLFNTTLLFDRAGRRVASYRKIHLYGYGSREQQLLTPGAEIVTCDVEGATVGLSTCYDLRFPELYRSMVDRGAELLVVVAGWPFPRLVAWQCLLRARAIENQAFVVGCNASGVQSGSTYLGASSAFDPWGLCLGELGDRPGVLTVTIGEKAVSDARATFPALADRRLTS